MWMCGRLAASATCFFTKSPPLLSGAHIASVVARLLSTPGALAAEQAKGYAAPEYPPPADEVLDMRPSLGRILFEVAKDALPVLRHVDPLRRQWLGDPARHVPKSERTGRMVTLELPGGVVRALLQQCRDRGVTGN